MNSKKIVGGMLVLTLLSCNYLNQMINPPTPTPLPTLTPTLTLTPTPEPLKPAFIPPECDSVPLATAIPGEVLENAPQLEPNPKISTADQLAVFDELTERVDEVYVYPDFNGKDWNGIQARYEAMIRAGLESEAFYMGMREMIYELGD